MNDKETIIIEATKRTNSNNEVLPNIYNVFVNGKLLYSTEDFKYALQGFINRLD